MFSTHCLILFTRTDVASHFYLLLCTGFCSPDQYRCGGFFFPTCIHYFAMESLIVSLAQMNKDAVC